MLCRMLHNRKFRQNFHLLLRTSQVIRAQLPDMIALADMIQAALMLKYNKRKVG